MLKLEFATVFTRERVGWTFFGYKFYFTGRVAKVLFYGLIAFAVFRISIFMVAPFYIDWSDMCTPTVSTKEWRR
jgi:hypothetical protein